MPYLQQDTTRLQTELQTLIAQQAPLNAQLATQQQAMTAAQAQRTNAVNAVAQAQARVPPLQAAAGAADRQVAEVELELQDAAEPPAGIPPVSWRVRLTALRKKLALAKTAATAAHAKVAEAQQGVTQAQAQVQAADRQVAAFSAVVQATQAAITALQTRQRDVQQQLAVLDRWEADIARDPLTRPSLERTAAELSAEAAKLEDAHLAARFELEDAVALLASLTARRDELTAKLNAVVAQLPEAQAQQAAAQQALAAADAEVATHLQDGP